MEGRVKDIYRKHDYQSLFYIAVVVLLLALEFVPGPADKVVFLDVGQGDAILLQSGTQQVLIDGGPGMKVLQRLGEELPWFDRTIEVVAPPDTT